MIQFDSNTKLNPKSFFAMEYICDKPRFGNTDHTSGCILVPHVKSGELSGLCLQNHIARRINLAPFSGGSFWLKAELLTLSLKSTM